MDTSTNQNGQTETPPPAQPSVAVLPPYDPDTPIGEQSCCCRGYEQAIRMLTCDWCFRCGAREDGLLLPPLLPVLLQRGQGQEDPLLQPAALRQAAGESWLRPQLDR